jgi:mannosyltransferase
MEITSNRVFNGRQGSMRPVGVWTWLSGLTILAAWLRIIGIDKCLWWDEIYFLVVSVRRPLAEIISVFPADTQHTLYSILARLSILIFGEHAWSLRFPALLFGVASIPVIYLLGSLVATRSEAWFSSAFLAISYHHVWFSQDARGYSALAFWAILSTYFLLRGMRTDRRGPYIAYSVVAALGIYTHLTMIFLVVSHFLVCAGKAAKDWRFHSKPVKWKLPLLGFLLAGVFSLVLYAPILTQVQNFFVNQPSAMRSVSTPGWAFWETIRGLVLGMGTESVLIGAALVAAFGAWSYFKQDRIVFALFALPGVVTALGAVLARGTMYPRFYFFLIGFAAIIFARGVAAISNWLAVHGLRRFSGKDPQHTLFAALGAVILMSSILPLARNYRYPKQDFEGAMRFVDAERKDGEIVITAGAATYPYKQYFQKPWESVETVEKLQEICSQGRTVWLVYTFPRYLEDAAPALMKEIRAEFTVIRVFQGTLGGGDVLIAKFQQKFPKNTAEVGRRANSEQRVAEAEMTD